MKIYRLFLALIFLLPAITAFSQDPSDLAGNYILDLDASEPACSNYHNYGWPVLGEAELIIKPNGKKLEVTLRVLQQRNDGNVYVDLKYVYENINKKPVKINNGRDNYGVKSKEILTSTWDGANLKHVREVKSGFVVLRTQYVETKTITVLNDKKLQYAGYIPWHVSSGESNPVCVFDKL